MNGKLFKIVLTSVIAILLAVIGGVMSADEDWVSLGLAIAPFVIAGLCLMKEKIWYLWIWLPILFIPWETISSYGPLFAYTITLPFYLWNIMIRRSSLTWNSAVLLDIVIFLLFLHVGYIFLTHPFGIGLNIMEDYYGGKGYVLFLQGFLAYLCLSSLKTNSNTLGKVLQWAVALTIFFTIIATIRGIISPGSVNPEMADMPDNSTTENVRQLTFIAISALILQLLIINYSIGQIVKRPWRIALAVLACVGIMISGFRSVIANSLFLFITISVLYNRWFVSIVAPILGLILLSLLSTFGTLKELPFGIQRTLSAVPFLDVSVQARLDAEGSTHWRQELWKWALDNREHFIQDKAFGDGFTKDISLIKANIYEEAYNLTPNDNQTSFAWNGLWHSGPVSTIHTIGYVGLVLYIIMSVIGMVYAWLACRIYRNHKYKLGILYVAASYFITPISFVLLAGDSVVIPQYIISLGIIKVLFCCAKREGLYVSLHVRKEYVPLMIRKEKKAAITDSPAVYS